MNHSVTPLVTPMHIHANFWRCLGKAASLRVGNTRKGVMSPRWTSIQCSFCAVFFFLCTVCCWGVCSRGTIASRRVQSTCRQRIDIGWIARCLAVSACLLSIIPCHMATYSIVIVSSSSSVSSPLSFLLSRLAIAVYLTNMSTTRGSDHFACIQCWKPHLVRSAFPNRIACVSAEHRCLHTVGCK
jgi:hypothetical protein